jgi:hypothetical protein
MARNPHFQNQRKKNIQDLLARLSLTPIDEWDIVVANFGLDTGISEDTILKYMKTIYKSKKLADKIEDRSFKELKALL